MMNATSNYTGHVHDDLDYYSYDLAMEMEGIGSHRHLTVVSMVVLMVSIVLGTVSSGAALYLVLRLRLWRRHEGYLYVLSLLIGNLLMIMVVFVPHWLWLLPDRRNLEATSDFTCKVWRFLVNVVYSTGWYLSGLLADVYLRGADHVTRGCRCWRRLVSRWCTVTGAVTVIGVMTSCFVVINSWTLWRARVHVMEEEGERFCTTWIPEEPCLEEVYNHWEFTSICIMWFVPVCFLVPILWGLVLWSQRGPGGEGGFAVFAGGESREFPRLALIVGALVFAVQFQMVVVDLWNYTADHHGNFVIYKVALLVFTTQLVAVPVCCLVAVGEMREGLRSWFQCRRCPSVARAKLFEEINGILALQTMEYPPPTTVIRD